MNDSAFDVPDGSAGWNDGFALAAAAVLAGAGLFLLSRENYLLFHSLSELVSIAVAWSVFLPMWNTRRYLREPVLATLGIACFFAGFLDLPHILAYKGMGESVDLVLPDPTMPEMDGRENFRELARPDSGVRVLVASGYSEGEIAPQFGNEKNFLGVVEKSYTLDTLRERLREILGSSRRADRSGVRKRRDMSGNRSWACAVGPLRGDRAAPGVRRPRQLRTGAGDRRDRPGREDDPLAGDGGRER